MNHYEFELQFQLHTDKDPENYLDALYNSGCDDANVGIGKAGYIGIFFNREANSAFDAIASALKNVFEAIPNVSLHRANPYLQNISELAHEFGLTKQNMRLYANNQAVQPDKLFPTPVISGSRTAYWLTAEVGLWLRHHSNFNISDEKIDTLFSIQSLNHANEDAKQPRPDITYSFTKLLKKNAA